MVDGWRGDDWFHNGAFRMPSLSYIAGQTSVRGGGESPALGVYDDYDAYLRIGSAGDYAKKFGIDKLTYTKKLFDTRPTTVIGRNRRSTKSSPSAR